MEQTFENMQREWALEQVYKLYDKKRELHEKVSKLEYELEMSQRQVKFQDGIIAELNEIIDEQKEFNGER